MTGLSQVNFDVQGLGDDEEEQLDKEDAERERELHEYLSNELPDDLLDDSGSTHDHGTPEFNTDQSYEHQNEGETEADTGEQREAPGYPHLNKISMLLTRRGEEFIQRFGTDQTSGNVHPSEPTGTVSSESVPRSYHGINEDNYGYVVDHGGYSEDNDDHHVVQRQYTYHVGDDPMADDDGEYYSDSDYDHADDGSGGFSGTEQYHGTYPKHDENFNKVYSKQGVASNLQQNTISTGSDIIDDFKVQYKRGRTTDVSESQHEEGEDEAIMGGQTSVSPSTLEIAQMQILHRARKRKVEELANELACKEKDYERQIRVLNHQLALMKGERDGMASSLKHAQEIATNRKNEMDELEQKLQHSDFEKDEMNNEKNEVECELESAKKTIESLHKQLMELEKSESLSRAREQHENVVMATKKRHEEDIIRLKQKLDDVNNSLMWKDEESKRLHDEVVQARKEADRVRLDRAETVNRLTKSLEQSQKQNEELLNSGSTQEISQLQRQLNLTQREKEDLQEHYKTIETDLGDLKEQLRIYESMSKLGVTIKDDTNDDVKRNLEADDWRTPSAQSVQLQSKFSTEEALVGLQKELQHSLTSNRTKREEIHQLRNQFEEVNKHLVAKQNETERLEMLVRKQEIRVLEQEKTISDLEELSRNPERKEMNREEELQKLKTLAKEQGAKFEQHVKHVHELEQLNLQLKSQMSEMVREYDADKQKSIEQCRQSCLEFHDQAVDTMKHQLNVEHDEELAKLRHELDAVTTELNQVKEAYVVLSEESRWIEKQTRERCEEEANERIKETQTRWDEAKSSELLELRQTLASELERALEKERATWREAEEQKLKSKVETEIALAKMDWNKVQQKLREEAIENALNMAEKEWLAKYGKTDRKEEWQEKIDSLKKEWEEAKRRELEQRLEELRTRAQQEQDERMNAARQEWGRLKALEIDSEIEKARHKWDQEKAKFVVEAERSAVEKAKAEWLKEYEELGKDKLSKARDEGVADALTAARKEWEREKHLLMTSTLASEKQKWHAAVVDEKQQAIATAVSLAEDRWNTEHIYKMNSAVKEALELAEATWRREKESAIESAVTQSLRSAKETWNESKIKEIELILSNARRQWFSELNLTKQESNTSPRSRKSSWSSEDVNKTFSYLETQYSKNLKEFRETELRRTLDKHERNLLDTVEELETKYAKKLREQEDKHQSQLDNIATKSQEDREAELKELETEYQNKLENIVEEIEEKWREKKAALEEDWAGKLEKEREDLQTSYREKYQKERESMGRQMRDKYEKGVEHARKKLEHHFKERLQSAVERAKHDWEAEQEEDRVAVEEQHETKLKNERERLRKEMKEANEQEISQIQNETLVKTGQLEKQLEKEKERFKMDIESLQKELQDIKQRRSQTKNGEAQTEVVQDQPWISLTEISDETPSSEKLNELRRQYLATTAQLKEDLMEHATETRNNAAKAIRSEVIKERHSTANQLRKYYLECLKQILDEDKEAYKNDQQTRSNEDKLKIMQERLRLPGEKDETIKSYESTLTNVTTLHDASSEPYPITTFNTSHPDKDSPRKPREHKRYIDSSNDVIKPGSRPPRVPTGTKKTKREENDGEVSFTRGKKRGEGNNPRQDGKSFSKELESTSAWVSLSTESFDSILSPQLSPEIEFMQPQISDILLPDRGTESDISDTLGIYRKQEDNTRTNLGMQHRERTERGRREDKRGLIFEPSPRESTRLSTRDTHSNQRNMHQNKRDTHSNQRDTRSNQRDTHSKRDTQNHAQPQSSRAATKVFSHPVIKSGNDIPSKVMSSLRKPVGDVLPSKPLSPATRSPGTFSYSMHSQSNARKTNK